MILGLDLATCTGFCYGRGEDHALPVVGHVKLPATGPEVGPYLDAFARWLAEKLQLVMPNLVVFEAPIHRRFDSSHVTRKLHALPGVAEMICFRRHIEVGQLSPISVKKRFTGSGRADKNQMCIKARDYGLAIANADEADAFAVWLVSVRLRVPDHDERWRAP